MQLFPLSSATGAITLLKPYLLRVMIPFLVSCVHKKGELLKTKRSLSSSAFCLACAVKMEIARSYAVISFATEHVFLS